MEAPEFFVLLLVPVYMGLGAVWHRIGKLEGKLLS